MSQVFTGFVPGTNPVKSPGQPGVVPRPTRQKVYVWKRLKGKNPEGKNFRKLLRRKQSSAKDFEDIQKYYKIQQKVRSEKSSEYLLRTFFLPRSFQKFLPFAFLPSGSFRYVYVPFSCLSLLLITSLVFGRESRAPHAGHNKAGRSHVSFAGS